MIVSSVVFVDSAQLGLHTLTQLKSTLRKCCDSISLVFFLSVQNVEVEWKYTQQVAKNSQDDSYIFIQNFTGIPSALHERGCHVARYGSLVYAAPA